MEDSSQGLPFNSGHIPNPFDEHLVIHPHKEEFTDSPAFIVLFLSCIAVIGSLIGVLLALPR